MAKPYTLVPMRVIMIHDVGGVGRHNEVKNVTDGYALNFLIPNGHAMQATAERLQKLQVLVDTKKRAQDTQDAKFVQGLEHLRGGSIRILVRANAAGGLYQELTPTLVAQGIQSAYGIRIPLSAIQIAHPIKKVGPHMIAIVHNDKRAEMRVNVEKNG